MRATAACVLASALMMGGTLVSQASASPILVYANDFESGSASVGAEWSGAAWHVPHGIGTITAHLGDYVLEGGVTLTLSGLPEHVSVSLEFDLYLFNTWDGRNLTFGPDFFSLSGDVVFSATFTNHQPEGQTYPGIADVNPGLPGPSVTQIYYGLDPTGAGDMFEVAHSASTFSVTFGGPTSQTDEQWGIDNVRVSVQTVSSAVPEPGTLLFVGGGLLALGVRMRCRR